MARICALLACMSLGNAENACIAGAGGKICENTVANVLLQRKSTMDKALSTDEELIPVPNEVAVGAVPLRAWRRISKHERSHETALLATNSTQQNKLSEGTTTMRPANQDEKHAFLTLHNLYRCMHGVPEVVWNDDVAANAEEYIAPMTEMKHADSYHIPAPAGPAGENLAWSSSMLDAADAVTMWYEEVNDCQKGPWQFSDGCADGTGGAATGHFTAMIWKGVTEIGCAFSDSVSPTVIICRYKAGDTLSLDTPNMNKPDNYLNHVFPQVKQEEECETGSQSGGNSEETPTHIVFTKYEGKTIDGDNMGALLQVGDFTGSAYECQLKCIEIACSAFNRIISSGSCVFFTGEISDPTENPNSDCFIMAAEQTSPAPPVETTAAPVETTAPPVETTAPPGEPTAPATTTAQATTPAPATTAAPSNGCSGDASAFSSGWGGCSTYGSGNANHNYCSSDRDTNTNELAADVCEGCGSCGASGGGGDKKESGGGSAGGGGGGDGLCKYADPDFNCEGVQCVPKDKYQYYSAAGGSWCLTNDSSYCQGTDASWCDNKCSCPGYCPHACGRCPAK